MAHSHVYGVLLAMAFAAANLPWLSERFLLLIKLNKTACWRWLEWWVCYGVVGLLAMALENKLTGGVHGQQWEFYVATLCLFVVFALPGFIYHYDLKKLLKP
ncbi:MAG: DUF2818 family protein [Methylomonas sp.]|jgi:hypothetical protein|uniref:DUF2818 family protein n=1 Tax=Methylomonas sp. TaxID=418 RepID=UPI0025D28E98|nr:DUF2818 family protein [Methylomonas sp.]MCK9606347.1 DUF2818 family protein [Methylomonas sp.]